MKLVFFLGFVCLLSINAYVLRNEGEINYFERPKGVKLEVFCNDLCTLYPKETDIFESSGEICECSEYRTKGNKIKKNKN